MDLKFAIIGPGSVGSALARSLGEAGYDVVAQLGRGYSNTELPQDLKAIAICTPDGAVDEVARSLVDAFKSWEGRLVFHVSGVLTSEVLQPLGERGAWTLSFHPLSTFPPGETRTLRNVTIALEGHHLGVARMKSIANYFGARPVEISAEQKGAYHLAASMASNYLVTLSESVQTVLGQADLDRRLMDGLVADTLSNLASNEPSAVLTGPIVRGDAETVQLHLDSLDKIAPQWKSLYCALARATADLAKEAGRITPKQHKSIVELL